MGTLDKYINQLIKSTFNYYRFRHITTVLEHISLSAVAIDVVMFGTLISRELFKEQKVILIKEIDKDVKKMGLLFFN